MTTVYYVSQTATNGCGVGDDSRSAATAQNPLTPWLTPEKAFSATVSGDNKILFNDGLYIPGTNWFSIFNGNGYTVDSITPYGAVFQAKAGNARVFNVNHSAGSINFGKIVMDGNNTADNCVDTGSNAVTWNYNGTKFINGVTGLAKCNSATGTYNFTNVIIGGHPTSYGLWNASLTTGKVTVEGLTGSLTNMTVGTGGSVYMQATAAGSSVKISGMVVNQTNAATATCAMITCFNISNLLIQGPGIGEGPECVLSGAATSGADIIRIDANNSVQTNSPMVDGFKASTSGVGGGHLIIIGSDGGDGAAGDYMISDGIVTNCDVRGSGPGTTQHGIMIGHQIRGVICHNRVRGVDISVLFKDQQGRSLGFKNDVSEGVNQNAAHVYSKGCTSGSFMAVNNIHVSSGFVNRAFESAQDTVGPTMDVGTVFLGNNLYADVNMTDVAMVGTPGNAGDTSSATFAFNNYNLLSVSGTPWKVGSATTYSTLAAWGAAQEVTYRTLDPTQCDPQFHKRAYTQYAMTLLGTSNQWLRAPLGL